jgi:hypothetical protein
MNVVSEVVVFIVAGIIEGRGVSVWKRQEVIFFIFVKSCNMTGIVECTLALFITLRGQKLRATEVFHFAGLQFLIRHLQSHQM